MCISVELPCVADLDQWIAPAAAGNMIRVGFACIHFFHGFSECKEVPLSDIPLSRMIPDLPILKSVIVRESSLWTHSVVCKTKLQGCLYEELFFVHNRQNRNRF